jgi:hypothetical protein
MKTTLDIEDILWKHFNDSSFKGSQSLTGSICKRERPTGSIKEDVVINCPAVNNLQLQGCVPNINIHVPRKQQKIDGVQQLIADYDRLNVLAKAAIDLVTDQWFPGYNFDFQQQNIFEDEGGQSDYINIRLDFYSINILN